MTRQSYLHSGAAGVLTGYSEQEKFGPCEQGASFGRHPESAGGYDFVMLNEPTPGAQNASPRTTQ